jgi:hypothetical protein
MTCRTIFLAKVPMELTRNIANLQLSLSLSLSLRDSSALFFYFSFSHVCEVKHFNDLLM